MTVARELHLAGCEEELAVLISSGLCLVCGEPLSEDPASES